MDDIMIPTHSAFYQGERATKSRSKSKRSRKFAKTDEETIKEEEEVKELKSDSEGPFWFEESHNVIDKEGKRSHLGISNRERQQLKELVKSAFFNEDVLRNLVVKLNDENSDAPRLRAYDWAVTNYAKGNPMVMLVKKEDGSTEMVDPNLAYEGQLRKHHRLLFDPFRRGTHIFFDIDSIIHRTTVGQLTFIKWCIENGVDKYVETNLPMIRTHMSKATKKRRGDGKRRELTKAPTKLIRGFITSNFNIITDSSTKK
jgi:hypothetical protein